MSTAAPTAIRSRGRRGNTVVPNWRWEDPALDPYELRVAGWLASHTDSYRADHVTRNQIARLTGMSTRKAGHAVQRLAELGVVEVEIVAQNGSQRWRITFDFDVWEQPPPVVDNPSEDVDKVADADPGDGYMVTGGGYDVPGGVVTTYPGGGYDVPATKDVQVGTQESSRAHPQQSLLPEPSLSTARGDLLTRSEERFDEFWEVYPRRLSKGDAKRAWAKAIKKVSPDVIIAGAAAFRDLPGRVHEFTAYPATWLNAERWTDELEKERRESPDDDIEFDGVVMERRHVFEFNENGLEDDDLVHDPRRW